MTLRLSPPYLDLALDTIAEFDLYEATPGLSRLLKEEPSPTVIATASGFALHPGAANGLRDQVLEAVAHHELDEPHIGQLVRLSLVPDAIPPARPYEVARIRRWPGTVRMSEAVAPIVALASSAGSYGDSLAFLLDLYKAGVVVRRLPQRSPDEHVDERWLARWIPVVAATEDEEAWWRQMQHGRVVATKGRLTPAVRRDTLRTLDRMLPPHLKLRLHEPAAGPATTAGMTVAATYETEPGHAAELLKRRLGDLASASGHTALIIKADSVEPLVA